MPFRECLAPKDICGFAISFTRNPSADSDTVGTQRCLILVAAIERDAVDVHDLHVVRRGILPNRLQLASEAIVFELPLCQKPAATQYGQTCQRKSESGVV